MMKKGKIFGNIMMAAALVLLAAILITEVGAVRELRSSYVILNGKDISEEEISTIFYDDKMLVRLGYSTADTSVAMDDFLQSSIQNIDMRIMTAGIVYAAVISVMLSCYLAFRYGESTRKHIAAVIICGFTAYLIILAAVFGMMLAINLPIYLPSGKDLIAVLVGLLSVLAGNCAIAVWLRFVRPKVIISVVALAVVFVTYLFGSLCEMGIFSEPTVESFEYLAEMDENIFEDGYDGECYYDESKNVTVLNGVEYPPEELPNPARFTGAKRAGAVALEALNPYSAMCLPLMMHATDLDVPLIAFILYLCKSMLWILLPALWRKKPAVREV